MFESPQSFVVATECRKAAEHNGFRRPLGETSGWAAFQSTTAQGTIWLAAKGEAGPWFLALDHMGVISEITVAPIELNGPGRARYAFGGLRELYDILPQVYQLGVSLPNAPLNAFLMEIEGKPQNTEVERLIVQRIGQAQFRKALLDYWDGSCCVTGIKDTDLLRASHIKPWARCKSDEERLDVHNGLLLSALWDAAFDKGLVTFEANMRANFSPRLSEKAKQTLEATANPALISVTAKHEEYLDWHRKVLFVEV